MAPGSEGAWSQPGLRPRPSWKLRRPRNTRRSPRRGRGNPAPRWRPPRVRAACTAGDVALRGRRCGGRALRKTGSRLAADRWRARRVPVQAQERWGGRGKGGSQARGEPGRMRKTKEREGSPEREERRRGTAWPTPGLPRDPSSGRRLGRPRDGGLQLLPAHLRRMHGGRQARGSAVLVLPAQLRHLRGRGRGRAARGSRCDG